MRWPGWRNKLKHCWCIHSTCDGVCALYSVRLQPGAKLHNQPIRWDISSGDTGAAPAHCLRPRLSWAGCCAGLVLGYSWQYLRRWIPAISKRDTSMTSKLSREIVSLLTFSHCYQARRKWNLGSSQEHQQRSRSRCHDIVKYFDRHFDFLEVENLRLVINRFLIRRRDAGSVLV